ncbi:hypothetical protein LY78DRAFT_150641 [Colletotrichum sublineola]|nr:hypothetical protein LY78DRAFT_150641 [Colletotrichum sublineola]
MPILSTQRLLPQSGLPRLSLRIPLQCVAPLAPLVLLVLLVPLAVCLVPCAQRRRWTGYRVGNPIVKLS